MALFKLALLVAFAAAVKAMGPSVFFDEDLNPECCENDVTALAVHPNADDARDAFFDHLDGVATNGFEEFMLNEETPLDLSFPGVMATIGAGSGEIDGGNDNGQYAISGDQFLKTQETVTITFDTPIAAFGFYGIDVGDVQGQLTFVAMGMGGDKVEVIIPHTREESDAEEDQKPSGSVLYFGFIDTTNPFISATLTNTQGFRDVSGANNHGRRPKETRWPRLLTSLSSSVSPRLVRLAAPSVMLSTEVCVRQLHHRYR
uniref:Uncharacterized protein n=1 Tax=Pinguiococcus pyrenoidosus TaxID=172671 RepID=A0A7R9U166_9STRA|mmetsp:Transcript_10891/g.40761  ORF Transcript_10891/g.40761 Transcript_10891/m.40761 type:complete len:259 (+) Transcript_10891:107-883(+)